MEILVIIGRMIWLMLPAYLSGPAAAISAKTGRPGMPVDFGKSFRNKRIFGDGKTYKGFITGSVFGIFIAFIENLINKYVFNNSLPVFIPVAMITLPVGAMLGDLIKSFIKRRLGFKRGQAFPPADQLDFVIGAWLLTLFFANGWFKYYFTFEIMLATLILTPAFHFLFNVVGYKIGVSREPW